MKIIKSCVKKMIFVVVAFIITSFIAVPAHASHISSLIKTPISVYTGNSTTIKLKNPAKGERVTWTSINSRIATISKAGKVTGKKAGTTKIKARSKSRSYTYTVNVKSKPKINYTSKKVEVGDSFKLKLLNTTGGRNWVSSNKKIATVSSSGNVTGCNVGVVKISTKYEGITYACKVTVKKSSKSLVRKAAPMADTKLTSAFDTLGFKIKYETSLPDGSLGGCFNAGDGTITLTKMHINDDLYDTIYHELGHFLSFIAGHVDNSAEYKAIYNSEKAQYRKAFMDSSYAVSSSAEYFADSYRKYVLEPSKLKSATPKTYAAIQSSLKKITPERLEKLKEIYGPFWQ